MKAKVIRTEIDYDAALDRVSQLMTAKYGTPRGDELELLTALIADYEDTHYPIDPPDPIKAIRFRMDQQGLKPKDLVPYIGSKGRVSEVLSGKRPLSLAMIRRLNGGLGIPAESLLGPYEVVASPARHVAEASGKYGTRRERGRGP